MKKLGIIVIVFMIVSLGGCASVPTELPTSVPTEPPLVDIGGTLLEPDVSELNLGEAVFELKKLLEAGARLTQVQYIDLGQTQFSYEQIEQIQMAYPTSEIDYSVAFSGQDLPRDTQFLDASAITPEMTDDLVAIIPMLPLLQEINFVSDDGICVYTVESIAELDKIRKLLPEAYLHVSFELFGQTVTSEDERIEYIQIEIGNEGIETVRSVLPYLRSCTYFLMDGCGVDDEIMAQLRDDFPETEIVWRIWLVEPNYKSKKMLRCGSYLTDTHRVRTTYVHDKNAHLLNYCTKTIYLDVGHVGHLTVCDFLSYMPDLEVCIIAITGITDITPLANHDKLEYLELFTTGIEDLTPLASCPNLEHLNLSNMKNLKDISPIYGLKNLKRLRIVRNPYITWEQIQEVQQMLPDCEHLHKGEWPTSGTWRWTYANNKKEKVERYALLCEQMEYTIDAIEYGIP